MKNNEKNAKEDKRKANKSIKERKEKRKTPREAAPLGRCHGNPTLKQSGWVEIRRSSKKRVWKSKFEDRFATEATCSPLQRQGSYPKARDRALTSPRSATLWRQASPQQRGAKLKELPDEIQDDVNST